MQDFRVDSGSTIAVRGGLPPLAPRNTRPTPRGDRMSGTSSGRSGRLSHRSRAGCWTCRGRKVKCDEAHPRCGPCTRLNRECDWDHRWNFNDATISTQGKFANVITAGSVVWDPTVRRRHNGSPISRQHDDLLEFAALTSDEDRERKAETQRPGFYGVVVTPESFHDLPEYAAAIPFESPRKGAASPTSSRRRIRNVQSSFGPLNTQPDPNTVFLERFEEVSPVSAGGYSISPDSRRGSIPEVLCQFNITTSPQNSSILTAPQTPILYSGDPHLILHFRQYIVPRLVQPQQDSIPGVISHSSTKNVFEQEAARFGPLHHAICAISALHLANTGRAKLAEAMQHYHQALAAPATAASPNELLSDGVFFRHFLLFIYDICIPMQSDGEGTDMWAQHLNHLRRLAVQRHNHNDGGDAYAYALWSICELDMYACLMGSGTCEFIRTVVGRNILPALNQQVPSLASSLPTGEYFLPYEAALFPTILHLNQGVVLRTAKIAQKAQAFRSETGSPGARARWQATASQLQADLHAFWQQIYLEQHLGPANAATSLLLPSPRLRTVFENALVLYHAAMIYARTSMFHKQRTIPVAGQTDLLADTERRVTMILAIATQSLESSACQRRNLVFPTFMAGYATNSSESKIHAMDLIRALEGKGIGQNTYRTRRLLTAVCEEQRRALEQGRRAEEVDWFVLARDKGLSVVNCGL